MPRQATKSAANDDLAVGRVAASVWGAGLPWHAAVLTFTLLVGGIIAGHPGLFSADEGLAILQAKQLAAGGGWHTAAPFPTVDPRGLTFGVAPGPSSFVIYGKHPLYPVLLVPAQLLGGIWAMLVVSIAGTVAAAWLAAAIVRRFASGLDRWVFWGVGLGSPLYFNGLIVVAHSVGAALATFVVLAALVIQERGPRVGWIVGACGAIAVAVMLRSEAVLFFGALGAALVVGGGLWRDRRLWATGFGMIAVTFVARVVDHAWAASLGASGSNVTDSGGHGWGAGLRGAPDTLIGPSLGGIDDAGALLLLAGMVLVAVGAWQLRHRRSGLSLVVPWALAVAVVCGAAILGRPKAVPGLFIVCPVLAAGLVVIRRRAKRHPMMALLAGAAAGYAALVLVTQYEIGGSAEWGARYLALAVPLAIALVVPGLAGALRRVSVGDRQMVTASLVTVSLLLVGIAVGALHRDQAAAHTTNVVTSRTAAQVDSGGGERPVIVTANEYLWRLGWPFYDDVRWMVVTPETAQSWVARLEAGGITEYVWIGPEDGRTRVTVRSTSDPPPRPATR